MRLLHTADWHLNQTLNGWSRDAEHALWLASLADVIAREEIDVLLVAGDVFDIINPSGEAQRLFYGALRAFKERRPGLITIISGGNHDPAGRLEAPGAILESLDVHVIATVRRNEGALDARAHMIPLRGADGAPAAFVCAIPFLRAADLPGLSFAAEEGAGSPIVAAARRFHVEMAEAATGIAAGLPVIAMGHLHCRGATESDTDGAERRILIGGEHALPEDVFPEAFAYVALGHLHRPQSLGGGRIRYAGSCFPLSAAEIGYEHGVTILDLDGADIRAAHHPIARPAEVIRLPARGAGSLEVFAEELAALAVDPATPVDLRPLVYVTLTATGPAAVLLSDAERLLADAPVRLAGIKVQRAEDPRGAAAPEPVISLAETDPEALFRQAFHEANGVAPEDRHVAAFRDVAGEG
jgi:exonuclease SbcD